MGEASDHGNWSTGGQTSRQFSVKDMPGHTKLKYRQSGQVGAQCGGMERRVGGVGRWGAGWMSVGPGGWGVYELNGSVGNKCDCHHQTHRRRPPPPNTTLNRERLTKSRLGT